MAYLDINGIKQAFAEHMIKYRGYSEEEAAIAVSDFPDPYGNCYLEEDYLEDCEIDDVEYEKNASYTAFWRMGINDVPMFKFYTYYCVEDIPNHQVGEYMSARKLFQVDELDLDEFPEDTVKQETHSLEFTVTLCLGRGDGGDVLVSIEVSDDEYELLKQCCRDDEDVYDCEGLEDLCERIEEAAQEENESNVMVSDEEIDYDSVSYMIQIPDEIIDEVDSESEEDDDEETIEWEDYCDYPFAMEVVNGEIISLTADFQKKIKDQILNKLQVTEDDLVSYLVDLAESEEPFDEKFEFIGDCEYDVLAEILGFDEDEETFSPEGIGFLDSSYGWEAKELLEKIGFVLEENIDYGPHGHGTNGVVFISEG